MIVTWLRENLPVRKGQEHHSATRLLNRLGYQLLQLSVGHGGHSSHFVVPELAEKRGRLIVLGWLRGGLVKYREDVTDGLENAPRELTGLLKGENFGKKLIRVSPDPMRQ
jgi:hypothetical protein